MIKTIIFDNRGVLIKKDSWSEYLDIVSKDLSISKEELLDKIGRHSIDAVNGRITFKQFIGHLIDKTGDEKHIKLILRTDKPDKNMIDFVLALKNKYKVALLTNDLNSFQDDNKAWHMEKIFDDNIFYSSNLKVAKPNKEAFLITLKRLKSKPEETVFIDDKDRNVLVANELGMKGITFESLKLLKKELKELGVNL